MEQIFISYRRDDNISAAKLLKAILESELGKGTVFLDTTTMGPGEKWKETLKDAVTSAKVVIALIGPYWKGEKYWGTKNTEDNRLLNAEDWVRLELETALLDKRKKIIPMIFHPDKVEDFNNSIHFTKDTLPSSLLLLAGDNNKAIVHEKQFEDDLKRTIIEISPFIKSEDVLAELPLPDFDPQNPLDFLPQNPYKGLDYFTEQDARIFFGRDEQIKELFYKLSGNPLVLFYGQSGVGKSSLLFAGLKRRMQKKGWKIQYWRREPTSNLAEKLDSYVSINDTNSLIILDQIEEIYTNQSKVLSFENEKFQLIESVKNALEKNIHVLLSFREEYLAKIQELLDENAMRYSKMPLRHMQVKGVLEAIEGITKVPEVKYNYNLSFEEKKDLPQKIAYLVLNDKESHVAPFLQLLLRKLWDRIGNREEGIITEKLFDDVKSQSLNEMLDDQVKMLRKDFSEEIDNGLVIDILYFFTTPRGTSASHTNEELRSNYDYERIVDLTEVLKNRYLLTDIQSGNVHTTRLAHDSLAPLIREHYAQSNLPGQRASRLLESKRGDIEAKYEVEFSKSDLLVIDAGKFGMRRIIEAEQKIIQQNWQRIQHYELELEEKNKQLELALKESQNQTLQAKAKALAATAREKLQIDPTIALRLAEAACKITPVATREAQSAIVDILIQKRGFYKNIFEQLPVWVVSVAISCDGNYILTGGSNETARLWSADGTLKQTFKKHLDFVSAVTFSPDNNYILTGGSDRTAVLWNLDGTQKQSFETKKVYSRNGTLKHSVEGHKEAVSSVAFSPDGKYILTGSVDKTAKLWSIDGTLKFTFEGHKERISSVVFSPKGEYVLTGSGDNTARLWNLDGTFKQSFEGHLNYVSSVAFSPDGNHVLTGSADKTAKLWNIDGTLRQTFDRHADIVNSVAFSPDGKYILTGCQDKVARLWKLDGTLKHSFEGHTHSVISVAFSPDGKYLVTASYGGATILWNIDKVLIKSFEGYTGIVSTVLFSPNAKYFIIGDYYDTATLRSTDGSLNQSFEKQRINDSCIAFSPDSKYVLIGKDNTAKLWTLDGTITQSFEGHSGNITSVAFSTNGKYILTTSFDKTVKIWNLNGKLKQSIREFQNEDSPPEFQIEFKTPMAAFSPDNKTMLVGDWGPTVKLYSLDGKLLHIFETDLYTISSVAFSPNGNNVLTGGRHGTILWDVQGTRKQTFKDYSEYAPRVTFTPDGKYILITSSDKNPKLWNLDGTLKHSFAEHPKSIFAFSPDGKYILMASGNKAKLFDFDGTLVQSFEDHSTEVFSAAFSPDGNYVLTGSGDRSAKIWCTFWHLLNFENVYVPTAEYMKEYDIPEDMEWGKIW